MKSRRRRRRIGKEFKIAAVRELESGKSVAEVARACQVDSRRSEAESRTGSTGIMCRHGVEPVWLLSDKQARGRSQKAGSGVAEPDTRSGAEAAGVWVSASYRRAATTGQTSQPQARAADDAGR